MISKLWKRMPILAALALASGLILAEARGGVAHGPKQAADAQTLEGTWRVRVSVFDCQTGEPISAFPALETFARGGTMTETSGTIVFPNVRSPGHGVWSADPKGDGSGRSYRAASTAFITRDGALVLTQIVTHNIQIGDNPDEFVSNVSAEFFNPAGELLGAAGCGTAAGERMQ